MPLARILCRRSKRPTEPTPVEVEISDEPPRPITDPTLGVLVEPIDGSTARQRVVALGDSLTQGFQSLAISKTHLSYPALIAQELGWFEHYRYPTYDGYGGLPFNLELTIRQLERMFGQLNLLKGVFALPWTLYWARRIRDWWDRPFSAPQGERPGLNHDLAVFSYQIADAVTRTLDDVRKSIKPDRGFGGWFMVGSPVDRSAERVFTGASGAMTLVKCAEAHGLDGGIETLIVALGANNVLDVVINLEYTWAGPTSSPEAAANATISTPSRFAADWTLLIQELQRVKASHVIVATVPHVTIVPLFAGVGKRIQADSPYFEYYTHAWLRDGFNVNRDPYLTGEQAQAIDSAVDAYNRTIVASVMAARLAGSDWYLFDMCGLLDRLAYRRHLSPESEGGTRKSLPSWWKGVGAYQLPDALKALRPVPDSRFFVSDSTGRHEGGLFALDGVHPTTIGYGIVAQEIIRIMEQAGVAFFSPGSTVPRPSPVDVDFARLLTLDSLMSSPPQTLSHDLRIVRWLNRLVNIEETLRGRPQV